MTILFLRCQNIHLFSSFFPQWRLTVQSLLERFRCDLTSHFLSDSGSTLLRFVIFLVSGSPPFLSTEDFFCLSFGYTKLFLFIPLLLYFNLTFPYSSTFQNIRYNLSKVKQDYKIILYYRRKSILITELPETGGFW